MPEPNNEQLAEIDTAVFFSRLRESRLYAELSRILEDYAEQAKADFLGYRGIDAAALAAYRARWHAREDFRNWLEAEIDGQTEKLSELSADLDMTANDLALRSWMHEQA